MHLHELAPNLPLPLAVFDRWWYFNPVSILLSLEVIVLKVASLCFALLAVSACASITQSTTQSVLIATAPKTGASCDVRNEKGSYAVPVTPGSITVAKAASDLTAICKTADGWIGSGTAASTTAGAAFGNILVGGIIGAAVDMSSGAAYIYPSEMIVNLAPTGQQPDQKPSKAEPAPVVTRERNN